MPESGKRISWLSSVNGSMVVTAHTTLDSHGQEKDHSTVTSVSGYGSIVVSRLSLATVSDSWRTRWMIRLYALVLRRLAKRIQLDESTWPLKNYQKEFATSDSVMAMHLILTSRLCQYLNMSTALAYDYRLTIQPRALSIPPIRTGKKGYTDSFT